jgi:1-acyl-sn-glycerol-3-phosphate acyltransferase
VAQYIRRIQQNPGDVDFMIGTFIKSLIFSIAFYIYTAFCCFVLMFAFLLPRRAAFQFVRALYFCGIAWVERLFLGLDYRVSGYENLPKSGSYILAVKHYSTYETLKMPVIFGDIAIILKRELSWIPFWGWYTIKTGMIPIDRGGGHRTMNSLVEGGRRVMKDNRPILIFPQGTRVQASDTPATKPYKFGTAKLAEALQIPIVPVALNSAAFWPKHAFLKQSGIVDFKILPVIPAGLPATETIKQLEEALEAASTELMRNPQIIKHGAIRRCWPRWLKVLLISAVVLAGVWAAWWHVAANMIGAQIKNIPSVISSPYQPLIDGFPGPVRVTWPAVTYQSPSGRLDMSVLEARIWPIPGGHVNVFVPQGMTLTTEHNNAPVTFTAEMANIKLRLASFNDVQLIGLDLAAGETILHGKGKIPLPHDTVTPVNGRMDMTIAGYNALLGRLVADNLVDEKQARMVGGFFNMIAALQKNSGQIAFPMTITDDVLYAGVLRVIDIRSLRAPVAQSAEPPQKTHSGDLGTDAHQDLDPQMLNPALEP